LLGGLKSELNSIGQMVIGAGVATMLIGGLQAVIVDAAEAERAMAATEAVVKSTGGAAGMTEKWPRRWDLLPR
jgi:hypothetical protein